MVVLKKTSNLQFLVENLQKKKKEKSEWWMPGLKEAKKDVVSCEKLRGGANDL